MLFTLRPVTHKHTPVLAGDTATHCLLVKDCSHDSAEQNFAYVQDMRRLSPACWNSFCGNVEHSHFPTLILSSAVGIFAPAHGQVLVCTC